MFHDGDLQSGIARAITEQKLVACFVRSADSEESCVWEERWLGRAKQPAIGDVFAMKAVMLKIEYGSQEMSFLNAFCPISAAPTFVVIDKGQVLEKVEAGVSQQDFVERISKALALEMYTMRKSDFEAARAASASASASSQQTEGQQPRNVSDAGAAAGAGAEPVDAAPTSPSVSGQATPASSIQAEPAEPLLSSTSLAPDTPSQSQPDSSSDMTTLFPARAQRLEVEKAKREAAEKADRIARANARRKEAEAATSSSKGKGRADDTPEKDKARHDWIAQQKQRRDDAKRERERILAQIEADKKERKARSQRAQAEGPSESLLSPSVDAASKRRMGAGGTCSLLIRLFDGSSIKGRFEPSATLAKTIRDWIKQTTAEQGNNEAADIPFTFKQIMAPQPSRSFEISEEHQSVAELGLTPNATLVLIPVQGYTEAYSSDDRGYMSSALHYTYALANGATGIVGTALSYVPGFGGTAPTVPVDTRRAPSEDNSISDMDGANDSSASSRIKVKTLADQRAEATKKDQPTEFYNGNSSAFQGRKDEDDDGKK